MLLNFTQEVDNKYSRAAFYILLTTLVCLAFSIRFVNSLSIIALVFFIIVHPHRKAMFKRAFQNFYFLSLLGLFLMQVIGLFYTSDLHEGWKEVTKKAGYVAIPFFFCAYYKIPSLYKKKLMVYFSLSLFIVSLYCLVHASALYFRTADYSYFFYHELVKPVKHHAVFFSFYIFYCLLYWMEEGLWLMKGKTKGLILLLLFFLGMIFLLSSKIVLVLSLIYIAFFGIKSFYKKKVKWLLPVSLIFSAMMLSVTVFTNNPVKERFAELAQGNSKLFTQKTFSTDTYFNGLQFRLLSWRFTYEILENKNAWLFGVSPGDAQHELNNKYVQTNMYLGGDKNKPGDSGFWNFNCHNLYLQTLLESGFIGLIFLVLAIAFFLHEAIRLRHYGAAVFFAAMLIFGFTESVLSSQYTILLFLFFPLLYLRSEKS